MFLSYTHIYKFFSLYDIKDKIKTQIVSNNDYFENDLKCCGRMIFKGIYRYFKTHCFKITFNVKKGTQSTFHPCQSQHF